MLANFKEKEAIWGRFPEGGVRVLLGDASRFVLTELDKGVSLKQLRALGGVHVCGGKLLPLSGRMRLHVFERSYAEDCRAQFLGCSLYMQRKAAGVW